jgi:glycine/serine hydroxymethyltransferase
MGTQEMTRYGMKETDFAEVASLLARIIADDGEDAGARWAKTVTDLSAGFRTMHYFLA